MPSPLHLDPADRRRFNEENSPGSGDRLGSRARAVPAAFADGGDFKLDFIAAAPFTYDHTTGGGAFDDRTIGKANDVVESLEGGDFACGDWVTHFVQISVIPGAAQQTARVTFKWTADSTGQSGAAYDQMHNPKINTGVIAGAEGEGPGGTDGGNVEVAPAASDRRLHARPQPKHCTARVQSTLQPSTWRA
jgi:hypothetical protein